MVSRGSDEKVKVIGAGFRLFHVVLMAGSAFLLYSALGLDDDGTSIPGTLNLYLLHRNIGLIWGLIIMIYAVFAILRRERLMIIEPLDKPVMEQIKEGFSIIGLYFFGRKISPQVRMQMGRHNILASYAFLLLVAGIILLGVGGIGLVLFGFDSEGSFPFLAAHVIGAGMLVLFVLAHLSAVVNRANRPLLSAVFTSGKVKREWLEKSMPGFEGENAKK